MSKTILGVEVFLLRPESDVSEVFRPISKCALRAWVEMDLFARAWLAEMTSKAKVEAVADTPNEQLRAEAPGTASAQKDLHLIEAALATDKIVVSLDDTARAELSVPAAEVMWVHPVDEGGHVIYWLNKGAEPRDEWKLGQP